FGCSDNAKRNKLSYLELINSLNAKAAIARFYADEDFDFFIEAWYPNYYDRTGFGAFLETLDRDYRLLVNSEADQYLG
ncbi:MAG: hypothetical protein NZL98_04340, partial [Anaerolineales bacterium]|nr:hypothetical protein [Anaerolineales bacterium]MDW8227672.1 hypothetical protein [Anaerolineales bacterium]